MYSIIKILPFDTWFPEISWKDIERFLLLVGVLGAFAALSTGETAEEFVQVNRQLVETHSFFASVSVWVYGALLVGEIVAFINTKNFSLVNGIKGVSWLFRLAEKILHNRSFSKILAIVGFIAITITGMLGGVITYGVTADPFAPLLLNMLGIPVN